MYCRFISIFFLSFFFLPPFSPAADLKDKDSADFISSSICSVVFGSSGLAAKSPTDTFANDVRSAVFCFTGGAMKEIYYDNRPLYEDYLVNLAGVVFGFWVNRSILDNRSVEIRVMPSSVGIFQGVIVLHFF